MHAYIMWSSMRRFGSLTKMIFPNGVNHLALRAATNKMQISILYSNRRFLYTCVDHNGVSLDYNSFAEARNYALARLRRGLLRDQYEIFVHENSKNKSCYTLAISKRGRQILAALDKGMVWNTARRQIDVKNTISFLRQNLFTYSSCKLDLLALTGVKYIENRRIRNAILDEAHARIVKSVFLTKYITVDALSYYAPHFGSGSISTEQIAKVHTIQDFNLRQKLIKDLIYIKLTGDIDGQWIKFEKDNLPSLTSDGN